MTYRVCVHIELEQFTGPLDLLLSLIEEEKLDVSTISLARVADHYVAYVKAHPETPLELMLHYLEIGSRLVILKTRLLLPHLAQEDVDDEDELVAHLKQYREYRAVSLRLNDLWMNAHAVMYSAHISEGARASIARTETVRISPHVLHAVFARIVRNGSPITLPVTTIRRRIFNLHERIAAIQKYLARAKRALFSELIETGRKHEIIVCFIALLELAKSRAIRLNQRALWGEIIVETVYGIEKHN